MKFEAGPWKYTLSFAEMVQQNETTKTKRDVRRRPQFVSAQKKDEILKCRTKEKKENGASPGVSTPSHWVQTSGSDTLVQVSGDLEEFKKVASLFHKTLPNDKISKVMRNQNIELWDIYRSKRERMIRRNGGKEVMELQLFHGTNPELVPAISQQNFDWRICGRNGTLYGKGSYFAQDSNYSKAYSGLDTKGKSRIMFVARVLVGTFVRGQSAYLRPPVKPPSLIDLHDSCVDNESNPTIFVIFEKDQVYPEYVIEYTST
uniref:protein mono-ADP-ribosyltransferase PARP12-like n=1 Tax=Myxine glutinosa TaxID=7769 RepID=UPI00358ECBC0